MLIKLKKLPNKESLNFAKTLILWAFWSEASGIRTPDNLIKSQVLYRLS